MDLRTPQNIIVPPYLFNIVIGICGIMFPCWVRESTPYASLHVLRNLMIIQGVSTIVVIEHLFHYSIHPNGIWMRFLWIPIRWIPWDNVSDAQFIQEWTTTGSAMTKTKGQGIVVTLVGCELFNPEVDGLNIFLLKHPIGSFFIRFAAKKKDLYVDIFRKYFPNLCFQFECTKHE